MQRAFFRRRRTQASSALTIALGLWAWACGGEAIIDPPLDGSGGANATSSTSAGMGSAGLGCVGAPEPSTDLNECGTVAVGVTSGGATTCSASLCDELGGLYTTECSDQGCRCSYNFEVICTCFVEGTSDICGSPELSCCPEPFPEL